MLFKVFAGALYAAYIMWLCRSIYKSGDRWRGNQ
jgi:hypothetical protein